MPKPIITFLTDFGLQDGYVASMKGVVLKRCPDAVIVDITHLIPPHDIRWGAYILSTCHLDFPSGTIHVAVVDPGVGTSRKPIAIRTCESIYIGPDNGIFSFILEKSALLEARLLQNPDYFREKVTPTFHGRDIFAPVAAHLASGASFAALGPEVQPIRAPWTRPKIEPGTIVGEVLGADRFGNIITNITRNDLPHNVHPETLEIRIEDKEVPVFATTYGSVPLGAPLALIGSSDHLEISINQGNAARHYRIRPGSPVTIRHPDNASF